MAKPTIYKGAVGYGADGWHYSVSSTDAGDNIADRLVLEDDGSYRFATAADVSWHDRMHGQFKQITLEDGTPGVVVSKDELAAVEAFLAEMRGS